MAYSDKAITINVVTTGAPSWASLLTLGRYYVVGGTSGLSAGFSATNRIVDVADVPSAVYGVGGSDSRESITKGWNSAVKDMAHGTHGALLVTGGGHTNYYGNEVYRADVASLTWERITDPYDFSIAPYTDKANVPGGWFPPHSGPKGSQPNGSPNYAHHYDMICAVPERRSFIVFRQQVLNTPSYYRRFGEFKMDTRQWQKREDFQSVTGLGSGGWSFWDSTRQRCVVHGGSGLTSSPRTYNYDPVAGTVVATQPTSNHAVLASTDTSADYSPLHDVAVIMAGTTGIPNGFLPGSQTTPPAAFTLTGTIPTWTEGGSIQWSNNLGSFIWKSSNGTGIYKLTRTSASPAPYGTWNVTNMLDAGNTVTPENMPANHLYEKFQLFEYSDGTVLGIMVKSVGIEGAGNLYAIKLN